MEPATSEGITTFSSRRVLAQELFGKTYDAMTYSLKTNRSLACSQKRSVLVRLPVSANVEKVYLYYLTKELQALIDVRNGKVNYH